jgi:hypothetical protein
MKDAINSFANVVGYAGVVKVCLDKIDYVKIVPQILEFTGAEIIDNANPKTVSEQRVDQMRANEACAACNKNIGAHTRYLTKLPNDKKQRGGSSAFATSRLCTAFLHVLTTACPAPQHIFQITRQRK